ncbi:hypothetical protein DSM104299_01397 [Baekduia alba]|uniref:hypothetical protein n=1 Tax=Baekduia alba TaxID=2997333 RepID=UPI0023406A1D|nr:hypothetical protein [Baekduia alba]WCB92699.1 hypothetical protein DSM104299_01397 [Baekduia alba]
MLSALRRALPLWLVLVAAYAVTLAVPGGPTGHGRFSAPEAHRLLAAESLVSDGDVDLRDEYATRAYRDWYAGTLTPAAAPTEGRLVEPVGLGFTLVIAPAYRVAGPDGVRVFLMMIAALGFCLAAALGRALVPEPWATRAALVVGLSPPAVGAATAVAPALVGATVLAGAALLALRVRAAPGRALAFWGAALVAALPWLATELVAPAVVIAVAMSRWLRRRQRGLSGFIALEVALTSAVVYITVSDRLYGGLTPHDVARDGATGASGLAEHLERAPRLVGVWIGDEGLLVWSPFLLLAFVALWRLWRSRRERLAVAVSGQVDVEVTATFLALIALAVALTATFAAPSLDGGGRSWMHVRHMLPALPPLAALSAWGWRFAPRSGVVLAALTVGASVALVATHL